MLQGMGYRSEATCILIGRIVVQGIIPIIMGTPTPGPAPSWLGCSGSGAAVMGVAAPASTGLGCPDAASLSCLVAVEGIVSVKGVSETSPRPAWPLHPTLTMGHFIQSHLTRWHHCPHCGGLCGRLSASWGGDEEVAGEGPWGGALRHPKGGHICRGWVTCAVIAPTLCRTLCRTPSLAALLPAPPLKGGLDSSEEVRELCTNRELCPCPPPHRGQAFERQVTCPALAASADAGTADAARCCVPK